MSFQKHLLPTPISYFEEQGLKITGSRKSQWFTTECRFHGGSDSMRVNQASGRWVCMACDAKGGDLIAYEMQRTGDEFLDVVKRLGAWADDGQPSDYRKPAGLSPRLALQVLGIESNLVFIAASNIAKGKTLTQVDLERLLAAAKRIQFISEACK
jgi:DNA primase